MEGFAAEYVGSVSGGGRSVGSAGRWADHWANFVPNVLSFSVFPWLKNLSQKCLFLKSLVFRKLAGFAEWTLKKLKKRGRERTREEKRGRDKETKRQRDKERKREEKRGKERKRQRDKKTKRQRDEERKREEKRGKERKKEERSGRDGGRKTKGPFFWNMNVHELFTNWPWIDFGTWLFRINEKFNETINGH